MATVTYPHGETVRIVRNTAGREHELHQFVGGTEQWQLIATATYNWQGLMSNLNRTVAAPGGTAFVQWGYNDSGQMSWHQAGSSVAYDYGPTPAAGKLHASTYTPIVPSTGMPGTPNRVQYGYDELGRLTSATSPQWTQGYVYDGFGNMTQKTGDRAASWVVNSARNTVGSVDAAGNTMGYTWDADNRMIVNGQTQYTYDGRTSEWRNQRQWRTGRGRQS